MVKTKLSESDHPRVVVGYDGSAHARKALAWVAGYARATDASVTVIAVWDWFVVLGAPVTIGGYDPQRDLTQSIDRALQALDLNPEKLHTVIEQGKAAQLLVDASRDADLLVVGRRGSGGFEHLVLGSVSSYCLSHAACTVCVVPTAGES